MKNLKSLLCTFVLFFALSQVSAGTNDKGRNAFSKKIQAALSTPKCLKGKSSPQKITVCFCVNANGDVVEANARTNNPEIKQHLEKQFLTLNLKGLTPCVTNTIAVNFVNY